MRCAVGVNSSRRDVKNSTRQSTHTPGTTQASAFTAQSQTVVDGSIHQGVRIFVSVSTIKFLSNHCSPIHERFVFSQVTLRHHQQCIDICSETLQV